MRIESIRIRISVFLVLAGMLGGCATASHEAYTLKIDSIADGSAEPGKFVIVPEREDLSADDLRFKEFSSMVANALMIRKFTPAVDSASAQYVIHLDCGISDPHEHSEMVSSPAFGQTTSSVKNAYGQQVGTVQTWGQTGQYTRQENYETFNRRIVLTAYAAPKKDQPKSASSMVWQTKITSTGSSDDLRKVFPIMLGGALQYIGRDTAGLRVIRYRPDSKPKRRILIDAIKHGPQSEISDEPDTEP